MANRKQSKQPKRPSPFFKKLFKQGMANPNTLADVQRLAYGMNTRIPVVPALVCQHKDTPTTEVSMNGRRIFLCPACAAKRAAGAMIMHAPKATAHVNNIDAQLQRELDAAAADVKRIEAELLQRARDAKQLTRAAYRRKYGCFAEPPKAKAAGAGK